MTSFKKRTISPEQVAEASAFAAASPMVAGPRAPQIAAPDISQIPLLKPLLQAGDYLIGQTYEVSLGVLMPNPVNPRMIYTTSAVDEMVESFATNGQQVAVTAFVATGGLAVIATGRLVLIDGEKRLRAARAGGLTTLRVEIRPDPGADRALYEYARATNLKRSEHTPLDNALRWKDMLERKIYESQAQLALSLQLPEETVTRTIRLAILPGRIIMFLADQPELMKVRLLNSIREFWEATDDERTIDLVREVAQKGMGYREVDSRRKSLLAGPTAKPRAIREPLRFGEAKGELKTFPDGRMELSLNGLNETQAEELRLLLVQTLKEANKTIVG